MKLYVFGKWALILWVAYRTFIMVSEGVAQEAAARYGHMTVPGMAGIVGAVIGGTIADPRTVGLFIGVILLRRKLKKQQAQAQTGIISTK